MEPEHSPIALLKSLRNKPCESALSKTVAPGNYSNLKLHMGVSLVLLGKNEHSYRFPLCSFSWLEHSFDHNSRSDYFFIYFLPASECLQWHMSSSKPFSPRGWQLQRLWKRICMMAINWKRLQLFSPSWTLSSLSDGKTVLKTILKLLKLLPSGTGMSWRKPFFIF